MIISSKALLAAGFVVLSTAYAAAGPAVVATNLKLRGGPGLNFEVITTMPAGAAVDAGDCSSGWCSVNFGGRPGYADARFISFGPPGVAVAGPVVVPGPVVVGAPIYVGPGPYYYRYGYRGYRGGRYYGRRW